MPYPTDSSVPSYVPSEHRAQWRHVWNSTFERTGSEEAAFKEANGVIKKRETASDAPFGYDRKISKTAAGYMNLDGAVEDAQCHIVDGHISLDLGCCNLFNPGAGVNKFSCGTCTFHAGRMSMSDGTPLIRWAILWPPKPVI